jgi:hypothetical protein
MENDWYRGKTEIASFEPEELFGTKLRALLQRRADFRSRAPAGGLGTCILHTEICMMMA